MEQVQPTSREYACWQQWQPGRRLWVRGCIVVLNNSPTSSGLIREYMIACPRSHLAVPRAPFGSTVTANRSTTLLTPPLTFELSWRDSLFCDDCTRKSLEWSFAAGMSQAKALPRCYTTFTDRYGGRSTAPRYLPREEELVIGRCFSYLPMSSKRQSTFKISPNRQHWVLPYEPSMVSGTACNGMLLPPRSLVECWNR